MTVLILSDSHGHMEPVRQAVERTKPDAIIHLGDYYRDGQRVGEMYPEIPIHCIPGNCDMVYGVEREKVIMLEGHSVFLCHGDHYGVKSSLNDLMEHINTMRAELVLFGHTHQPYIENRGNVMLVNPGSIGAPPKAGAFAYAVACLEEGKCIQVSLKRLDIS